MKHGGLLARFQPRLLTVDLPVDATIIDAVEHELTVKAQADSNQCWGYFPAMVVLDDIAGSDLPASRLLAESVSELQLDGRVMKFNFARLSVVRQQGSAPYHIDTDSASALTGDVATLGRRLVWRLLINLSPRLERELGYLDIDPEHVTMTNDSGYVHYTDPSAEQKQGRSIIIPPRNGSRVSAVLFCASRILHAGKDGDDGHFVAGYGCEEVL